jgi:autotransporter-associated beta strand protein
MLKSVYRFSCFLSGLVFAVHALGEPPVLKWNGPSGGIWDTATANWLDASENTVAWIPGAEARFEGAGGLVDVAADVPVSGITFASNGYTLLGAGRLIVEGAVSAAAATTNSVAAGIVAAGGLAKTGPGALALARCVGPLAVQEGALLVSGSLFADADVSVAVGASLVTLGGPAAAANLIANSGFEDPVLANGAWAYRDIPSWTRTANASFVGMKNTAAAGEWALQGASPEGVQMAIVQGGGALSQTVTVPADGLYSVAFSYMMRNQTPAKTNQVYVSLGGVPLAAFRNTAWQTAPGRFVSVALWLPAGSHTLTVAGEAAHGWADCTTLLDAVRFAPPSAAEPCRSLGGDSALALASGASVVLSHSGAAAATLVTVNGASVGGGFTYDASHLSGIFSGPGSLAAQPPENIFTQAAAGDWSAAATWQNGTAPATGGGNNLLLRLTADSANNLAGGFLTRRLQLLGTGSATFSGNAVTLAGPVTQPLPGTWTVSAPLSAASGLFTVDNAGGLTLTQPVAITNTGLFVKTGPGSLTLAAFTNSFNYAYLYGGTVSLPSLPASPNTWDLYSSDGCPAALRFTAPGTVARRINLYGSGFPTVATAAGGGTVTLSEWTVAFGANAVFDVADGDTLSLRQLLRSRLDNGMASASMLLKTGSGTLEIRSAGSDTDKNRAYSGPTVLRNGTLLLSEDDWGTLSGVSNAFNGRVYAATGGSLGYNPLTDAVAVGDGGTAPADDLALIANGDGRWIGHDIEVFNRGASVTLGMTAGTAKFGGTVTLHRDIALSGPADGTLVFETVVAAPDFSGTGAPVLSGLAGLTVEGSLPAGTSLAMDGRRLSFGTRTVRTQTLSALALGSAGTPGGLDVDFAAGANDVIAVTTTDGLTLDNTVVNLYYAGSGLPFAEPGIYTLFTYAGALGGDPAPLLSVGNPQAGATYVFADDPANGRVMLTVSGAPGDADAVWAGKGGGDWGTAANWAGGTVPAGAGVVPLFGLAVTNPAVVNLETPRTAGGLLFNNAAHGYTLAGTGGLTLDAGGGTLLVSVLAGTHTLDTALAGADGLEVATAAGATLVLGPDASVAAALTLSQGTLELRGAAAVDGPVTLAADTLLRAADTAGAAVGPLAGPASAVVALRGTAPRLTVNQTAASAFSGMVSGGANATLTKAGAAALTLDGPLAPLSGKTAVNAGTLALKSATLRSAAEVAAPAALEITAPATNGLTGYFYNVAPNTNHYWTLSAMESHFALLAPDFAAFSGARSNLFDFGVGTPFAIAGPYASSGSRPENFEAVWRGSITVPASGTYVFGCYGDDGYLLAIDGRQVLSRNVWIASWCEGAVDLTAGRHDIVLGYFQRTGSGGIRVQVRQPGQSAAVPLPNTWLTPHSQTGPLSGTGALALTAAASALRANVTSGGSTFGGAFSGVPGALLAKTGGGMLSLTGGGAADAFAGEVEVQAGILAFNADERLADSSGLTIHPGATLAFAGTETAGALNGGGTLALGGNIYVVPFTGDADSDISPAKTYTHLVDFPTGSYAPVINGVTFGNTGPWAFTGGTQPTGAWNTTQNGTNDTTVTGIDSLLWDFTYGSEDFTMTLSGLTPGKAYETRLYFRNFANNTRHVTFTFTAGAREVGSLYYNPDSGGTGARSWLGCRYTADDAGTLSIRVFSHVSTDKCHVYGFSNEEITGATSPVLTVAPAAGVTGRFTGAVAGLGALAVDGAGAQRFGGAVTLPAPLEVRAGTVTLDSGASVPGGATVAAGATLRIPLGGVTLGSLSGEGTVELTGVADYAPTNGPRVVYITGDADSGISSDKVYTHLLDFGGSTALAVVNGVAFNKERTINGPLFGQSWTNAPVNNPHAGGNLNNITVPTDSGVYNLVNDFGAGGPHGVFSLTGLTTGKTYEVRLYHRKWSSANRTSTLTFDPDGTGPISDAITINTDAMTEHYVAYRYLAATNRLAITLTCPNPDKYHIYGLSNEEVPADGGAATLDIADGSVFGGALSGSGTLVKTGAGRLVLTGTSTASGPVTVAAGALGAALADAAPLTSGTVTFAPGTALACVWSGNAGGTLAAGRVDLPAEGFTLIAQGTGQPPATWPVIVSQNAPISPAPALEDIALQGFPASVKLRYSDDGRILYLLNPRGTLLTLQ